MITRILCVILLGFFSVRALSEENSFQLGLTAFQQKNFAQARDYFQKAAETQPFEASILHNWALTELQLGKKGFAIALWRKALVIDPNFTPAVKGREFLESRYQIRPLEKDAWSRTFNRFIDRFSFDELLGAIAVLLAAVSWLWIRFFRRRKVAYEEAQPSPPFPTVATIFTIVLSVGLSILALRASRSLNPRATIVAERVSAKSLPSAQGAALFELAEGSEVLVRRTQENWLQVTNSDDLTGWVESVQVFVTSGR